MTITAGHWFAVFTAGFTLFVSPMVQAQTINAPEAVHHADLYARVKVAGFTALVDIRQSGPRTRLDLTAGSIKQSYIADKEKGVLISLTATGQNRIALVFPLDRADGIIPLPLDLAVLVQQATLKVVGASMVSGRPCRLIEFSNYLNQSGLICASAENVILKMTRKGQRDPLFEVLELTMARQDAKWFRAPPDYQIAVLPAIGGASASGEGGGIDQPPSPGTSIKPPPVR